jgi:hypothetical protein
MTRLGRRLIPALLLALFGFSLSAYAGNVTVSGTVNFSALDGSADDEDHVVNGVFTVSGDLVVNGTILCIDDSGRESACPMSFNVGHDLIINAGGGIFAENRTGTGSGAPITFTVGHDFVMHGPTATLAGAVVSTDSTSSSGSSGGNVTANVSGAVTIDAGATIDSGSANAAAGAISIVAGGHIDAGGNVLAGPSRTILATRLTGDALAGGTGNQVGGAITLKSTSFIQPGVTVGSSANIVSQGQTVSAGPVMLEGCGVIVDGLVASLAYSDAASRVVIRSGKTIDVDGRDLGVTGATLGRNGKIRGDAPTGTAVNHFVDLFAFGDISVLGPDPAASALFAVSGTPGVHDSKSDGATIRVISLTGGVTASGNVIVDGHTASGDDGGNIAISSQGNINLDHAVIASVGDSNTSNPERGGGTIAIRSYSGNVVWTSGTGDVRPTGSSSGLPTAAQGAISITACGSISLSGSSFPTDGPPVGVFPGQITSTCTPASPSLPAGEPPLPVCCNVITITNPSVAEGTAGVAFNQSFTQSGAIGTATFTLFSGTLPAGLTLSSSGVLSGTPTVVGSFPIVVKVTDSQGCTGVGTTYNLHIGCQTITVNNPAVSTTVAGSPFSATFTQSGAIGGATFSTSSALPTGLTFTSGGVLSGTPTVVGSFPIAVTVTDGNGCSGSSTYTLTITCQSIAVTKPASASGTVNVAFSAAFTQSGALGGATFTTASALPAGLALSASGTLGGTPTQTGTFAIVVTVTDGNGCTGTSATYNLTIACQVITVTNPAVNGGTVNVAFSQQFTASNTVGATTFTTASALPAGLTLSANGTLSGTPTQTGAFAIVVTVTDGNGCSGTSATYNLTIACQVITVTNPAVNSGTAGTAFGATFSASNTVGTTTFSTASALPTGITLASNGVLSGTPTVVGTFPIVVTVTDGNGCTGTGATYTLTINCQVIGVTAPAVNSGVAGAPFSQAFTQSGAIGGATFSLAAGVLPGGLALGSNGVLSGTPLQTGTFPITVKVTDGNGCTGTASYILTIVCPVITVTNPSVTGGTAGVAFAQNFTESGAVGSSTFSTTSTLPAGLSLSATGLLSGTPTQTGTFPIVVTVTDANGCTGTGATYNLTIACQTITVTAPSLNTGTAGSAFTASFTQSGAIGGATFSLASGTLPAGMTLAASGTLSGVPLQTGSFPITVTVTDGNGCTGTSATYTLTVVCQTITVTHPDVMSGTVGTAFSQQYTQSGGIGTVTFSTSSTLPTGMTLAADGTLSGTPTQSGTFPITVTATDSNGCTGVDSFTLMIGCQTITVTKPTVTSTPAGTPFSAAFTQSGGVGTVTFSLASGTLPTGLTLAANGTLSGTPTQGGTFTITVTATDSNGCTGTSAAYTLTVTCPTITVTNPSTTTATVGSPFSVTFTQSGGVGTVTFTTSSTLPSGVTLAANGTLSGTPSVVGTFPIVVTATDANGCTGTGATYTLVVNCQVITVTNPATSSGTVDAAFSATFTESGAISTATFSLASGTLPAGLTLSSTGMLTGTPQEPGSFPITVTVTDANGCTGTGATFTLVINCQSITVANPSSHIAAYTVALSGSFTFTQTGAHGTATFSLNSGSLPAGVSLSAGGVLSGTPTQTGLFTITVKVTDANGCTGTSPSYTLTVTPKVTAKSYTDVGNTQLDGGLAAPATPTVVDVALSNGDTSDTTITYAIIAPPSHGTFTTFNGNGTFLYTPNVGNTTADSFTYTATSNGASATVTATVAFIGRVWYVDNATLSGTNDGRSNTPFKTMTAVGGVSTVPGDIIYVSKGSGPTTGSYTMLVGQQLIGAGATLSAGGVLTVTGAAANTPTLSGTLTLAGSVTVDGIDMSTGTSAAITGSGVSGISVTARNVTTTTGAAVTIAGTGNGGTMSFTQINAGTTSSGPANAISIANFSGSFTVAGDGTNAANGSGGTIQKTTGSAVVFNAVAGTGVSLSSMIVKTSAANGINGTSINNLSLLGCQVQNNGTTSADVGVNLIDTTGVLAFTNTSVTGSKGHNVSVGTSPSSTAALSSLSVTNGAYSSSAGGTGFLVALSHSASIATGSFSNVTFGSNASFGLNLVTNDNSILGNGVGTLPAGSVTITGCTFTDNTFGAGLAAGGGAGAANSYVRLIGNTLTGTASHAINVISGASATGGLQKVRIDGNTIGNAGVAGSGSSFGNGINVTQQGKVTQRVTIVNNVLRQIPFGRGIDVEALGPVALGQSPTSYPTDVFITGNDVNPQDTSGFPVYAIYVSADDQGSPTLVHAEIHGNTVPSTDACDTQCGAGIGMIFYERTTSPSTGTLFNFAGGATVSGEIAATNSGTAGKTTSTNTGLSLTTTATQTVP